MNKRNLPFWLFIISLFFLLLVRDLFRDGMFMDGMIYTSVAKNLANGLGTFWHPHFSQTLMPVYHEQPPLLFGIEAVFFKVFGNSMYAERIYGLFVFLTSVWLIHNLWRAVFHKQPEGNNSWLPILFWLIIPVCFWSYANNMEETIMGMFDLAALLFIYKAVTLEKKIYLNLAIAALMLIAASMCKGVQGLFPLTAVFFYWTVFRTLSFSKMLTYSLFLLTSIVAFYGLILLNDAARSSYEMYFNNRIVTTFAHPASTHTDRFYIVEQLFSELLPVFILMLITGVVMLVNKKRSPPDRNRMRIFSWFLLIALSGTLPLMLTIEQSGYYLVTVMPYYTISFAILFSPFLLTLVEQIKTSSRKYKVWRTVMWVFLVASIIFSVFTIASFPKRDKEMLSDVYCTAGEISKGSIIGIPQEMAGDWSLQAYFVRYFNISLDPSATEHPFFLIDKTLDTKRIPEGYSKLNLPTQKYNLYRKL